MRMQGFGYALNGNGRTSVPRRWGHTFSLRPRFRTTLHLQRGERLEAQTFSSKPDCDRACKGFFSTTYNDFADDWVYKNNPHPNF